MTLRSLVACRVAATVAILVARVASADELVLQMQGGATLDTPIPGLHKQFEGVAIELRMLDDSTGATLTLTHKGHICRFRAQRQADLIVVASGQRCAVAFSDNGYDASLMATAAQAVVDCTAAGGYRLHLSFTASGTITFAVLGVPVTMPVGGRGTVEASSHGS